MKRIIGYLSLALSLNLSPPSVEAEPAHNQVDFPTEGGIHARGELYPSNSTTLVLLFHQAGWSRGEYREIAPKLRDRGYQVMAVDQRAGKGVNGVANETYRRARKKKLGTEYLDAYADLEAALAYAVATLKPARIIVWGSSYSAALVFRLAAERPEHVDAVVSFSPGEYFASAKSGTYVRSFAQRVNVPVFVTSAKKERGQVKPIFDAVSARQKVLFTPASLGRHGSSALWRRYEDSDVYWASLDGFLKEYVPPSATEVSTESTEK